jgi:3-hydroxyacyl-CoA dehydrogenase
MPRAGQARVSSNTSRISISAGTQRDFRRHWLGTHFFNPPGTAPAGPDSDGRHAALGRQAVMAFDHHPGKGVVVANSPGFIGNHLGLYG